MDLKVGTLVVCTNPAAVSSPELARAVGMLVEPRKRDARIVYLDPSRSFWLPLSALRPATAGESDEHPLGLVARLVGWLGGRGVDLEPGPGGRIRARIDHGAVTPELIDSVREKAGVRLTAWKLRPAGLSKIQSLVELQPGPGAGSETAP